MALLNSAITLLHSLPLIIMSIFGIGFVIAFHEFGHFIFGKLFGVNIPAFSIGFGPQLVSTTYGGTTFSISLIPIGGYVEAEAGDPENPSDNSIEGKAYWQKMCIVGGGILCNLILAYAIFVGLSFNGIPANSFFSRGDAHIINAVQPDSAAEKAGIFPKDKILQLNHQDFSSNISGLVRFLACHPDENIEILLERDGHQKTVHAHLATKTIKGSQIGSLGVYFGFKEVPGVPFIAALKQGYQLVFQLFSGTLGAFKNSLKQRSAEGLSGPLMMISIVAQQMKEGFSLFFLLLAFISVGLAVLNLFPLPILDGGQALIYTIEAIIRRPIPERIKESVGYACWLGMMGLFLYLTFKDAIMLCFQ